MTKQMQPNLEILHLTPFRIPPSCLLTVSWSSESILKIPVWDNLLVHLLVLSFPVDSFTLRKNKSMESVLKI